MRAICTRGVAAALAAWLACGVTGGASFADEPPTDEPLTEGAVDFASTIRPIFEQHCYACHGPDLQESGLRLSSRDSALAGGDSGEKAIVPGDPQGSRLIRLVQGTEGDLRMPPEGEGEPLSDADIDLLRRWVAQGADWPAEADLPGAESTHWAWQPPRRSELPDVRNRDWPRNGLDYFVLARLESEGLAPAPEADRYTIARRLYLDLTGLPPPAEAVEAFAADASADAYERLVNRLLADTAFGERWARMWLDLARYADSKGYGSDPLRTIWRYRDWVIDSMNRNQPFDEFTIDQIAGDLLPNPTPEQILATAFHRNTMSNDEGGTDDEEFRVAAVKDRIETTLGVWMGLTVGCAKCHSHKYDPITQREYYQLYAFFNQSEDADRGDEAPLASTPPASQIEELDRLRAALADARGRLDSTTPELAAAQAQWEASLPSRDAQWQVLTPTSLAAASGATLAVQSDGSVLVSGASSETDTYTIGVPALLAPLTAFRVEVLPHESLPAGGPGRQPDSGGLALSELRIALRGAGPAPAARYVRLELAGHDRILSLAEVQAFRDEQNLALAAAASQSSTDYGGVAERAIDGNTEGDFFKDQSVTHTASQSDPWWECDLGTPAAIDRLVIWNRTDNGTGSRLAPCRVKLLDDARQVLWEHEVRDAPNPSLEVDTRQSQPVALVRPSADAADEGLNVAAAIDGDTAPGTGWGFRAGGAAHAASFALAQPFQADGDAQLDFTLVQEHGMQHTLGRFRLSAATSAPPPVVLPERVAAIVAAPPADRSPEAQAELATFFRTIAPELQRDREEVASLESQIKGLEASIPQTPIMRELPPGQARATRVMVKGNFLAPGDVVEPAVPAAFPALPAEAPANRLGLALWLVDEQNPLTARVAVNRYWAQLFGVGLVETQEDFGTQGSPPSHPELLDWLAVEFGERDWNVKDLLRLIVTSATYRQSSTAAEELVRRDPANRLLARGPRFRLEAELVRDQSLALAGLLSRKIGGPSVYPPQPEGLWQAAFNGERTWATSTGEDRYRRGLYTFWRRTVPYPSMAAFDAPSREVCTLRRISTNTPLQAFVTLNDPVYVEAAQGLARRIVAEGGDSTASRAAFGLRLCLARPPHERQIVEIVDLFESALAEYGADPQSALTMATEPLGPLAQGHDPAEMAAWTVVGNVLLNLDGVLARR